MASKLIKIDKMLYAVGFNWHTYTDKKQIPQKGDEYLDCYTINNNTKQLGFGLSERDERYLGTYPLISVLKLPETYLGIFSLSDINGNEFTYILAIKKGHFISDNVFEKEEDVQVKLTELKEFVGNIQEVIFDTPDKSLTFIKDTITAKKKFFNANTIRPLYSSKKYAKQKRNLILFVLTIVGISYGLMSYLDAKNLAELRASSLFSRQTMENKIKNIYANKHRYFKMVWKDKAFPLDVFYNCQPRLFSLPIVENGWVLDKAICTQNELLSYWEHKSQASFIDTPFGGELVKPKEVQAKHEVPKIEIVQKEIDYKELLNQEESSKLLYQITQNMGANLNLSFGKNEVKEFKDLKISIVSPWKQGKFEWKSVPSSLLLNNSLFVALNKIPSLSIKKIEYSNKQWSIAGEFYVKS